MSLLQQPLELRSVRLDNRIVAAPTATGTAAPDGTATEAGLAYYGRLAGSGVGLAIIEHHAISREGRARLSQYLLDRDEVVEAHRPVTACFKAAGLPVFVQINHAGSAVRDEELRRSEGVRLLAPSPVSHPSLPGVLPQALTQGEIDALPEAYAAAARRAVEAGYDGVEIHACHGYLLSQFLSPLTNIRTDRYGGDILRRARILFEVFEAVRSVVDSDLPVAVRLGAADTLPGEEPRGLTIEESRRVARELASLGVDLLDISGNLCGYDGPGEAWFAPYCRLIRDVAGSVPVVCTGGIRSADAAEMLLRQGICDLVGIGRPLLEVGKRGQGPEERGQTHTIDKEPEGRGQAYTFDKMDLFVKCVGLTPTKQK